MTLDIDGMAFLKNNEIPEYHNNIIKGPLIDKDSLNLLLIKTISKIGLEISEYKRMAVFAHS